MIVGLDWDGTVTADPEAFKQIVQLLRQRGHRVYIVTMRYPSECAEIHTNWGDLVDGIYATGRTPKAAFMLSHDIPVGVWIDDNPRAVHEHAVAIWGSSSPEGTIVIEDHNGGDTKTVQIPLATPEKIQESDPVPIVMFGYLQMVIAFKRDYLNTDNGCDDLIGRFNQLNNNWWFEHCNLFTDSEAARKLLDIELVVSSEASEGSKYEFIVPDCLKGNSRLVAELSKLIVSYVAWSNEARTITNVMAAEALQALE